MAYSGASNRRKHWWRVLSVGQRKLLFLGVLLLLCLLPVVGLLISYSYRAAQYDVETVLSGDPITALYDYDSNYIAALPNVRYIAVKWEDLPKNLINAFVAREDEDFFEHSGIVYSAVVRSIIKNIASMRYEQGASTITMQLTRNVFEMQGKTLDRKLVEAFVARRIESRFDKQTILHQYLSRIYFGQNCYGIGAAAAHYFGKHVKDLSLSECAVLAGLVRGPSIFNPRRSMESAKVVKRETLNRMRELNFITDEEWNAALAEPIALADEPATDYSVQTYMTQWVNSELQHLEKELDERSIGMGIVTSFDLSLQQYVEEAAERAMVVVENRLSPYPEAWAALSETPEQLAANQQFFAKQKRPTEFKVRGDSNDFNGLLQCCVLVVDGRPNHAGELLAITSGRSVSDGVNRWRMPIQPGRNAAPILFCATGSLQEADAYILTKDVITTGTKTGYEKVMAFYRSLLPDIVLPPEDKAEDLYMGQFPMSRADLARILFSVQNGGRGYDFYAIKSVWSRARHQLHAHVRNVNPEWIQRQSADTAAAISPFVRKNEKLNILCEPTLQDGGCWTMVSNRNGVAVFVWMGFDSAECSGAKSAVVKRLVQRASLLLARELHREARNSLIKRSSGK